MSTGFLPWATRVTFHFCNSMIMEMAARMRPVAVIGLPLGRIER